MKGIDLLRADACLRGKLTESAGTAVRWTAALLTAAAFGLLMLTRTLRLVSGAGASVRLLTAAVLTLPLCVMLAVGMHICKSRKDGVMTVLLTCALCVMAMLARVSFIERSSGDYDIYLADWLNKLAAGSFADGMRRNIGEYNVLYQYILFLITRLPVPSLYAVKAVSFAGDALLAGAAASLVKRGEEKCFAAFGAVLLLPTVVLNGGMFAQCDSLYAACALWGLAFALDEKPRRAAVCWALSLAFKLQACFLLPMVAVLWADEKLTLREALIFVGTLLVVALPALLGGKAPSALIATYTAQTGLYNGLTYNAPNFFGLMRTDGLDVYAYGNFGMALAFGVCCVLVHRGISCAGRITRGEMLHLALLMPLCIVFLLPRMHERYFYLADVLSVTLACCVPEIVPAAALIALTSLCTYWETALPLPAASCMMLLAIVIVARNTKKACVGTESVI